MPSEYDTVPFSFDSEHFTTRTRDLAEIVISTTQLVEVLKSDRQPDVFEETYIFSPHQYHTLALPGIVSDRLLTRNLIGVNLTIGREDVNQPSWMSLSFEDDDDSVVYISRSGTDEEAHRPDAVLERKGPKITQVDIPKISTIEINRFISSLIESDKIGDYTEFDNADLLSPESFNELTGILNVVAPRVDTYGLYQIKDVDGSLSYATSGGELVSMRLTHGTANKRRKIVAELDCQTGIGLSFYAEEEGERIMLIPDEGDILAFQEMIDEAIGSIKPLEIQVAQNIEETVAETSFTTLPAYRLEED